MSGAEAGQRIQGQLTKDKLGFSLPADAPLYPAPPYRYPSARLMMFPYITRAEAAARLVPASIELDAKPLAGLVFASYPSSSLGPYDEVVSYVAGYFRGQPVQYAARLYVTTDVAMAAGREMGGFPKAIARIRFQSGPSHSAWMERPEGIRLCSGVFRPERPAPKELIDFPRTLDYATLRLIPSPQAGVAPTLAEVVLTRWVLERGQAWTGTGSFQLTGASALDPLDALPVVQPLPQAALYVEGDMVVAQNQDAREYPL